MTLDPEEVFLRAEVTVLRRIVRGILRQIDVVETRITDLRREADKPKEQIP